MHLLGLDREDDRITGRKDLEVFRRRFDAINPGKGLQAAWILVRDKDRLRIDGFRPYQGTDKGLSHIAPADESYALNASEGIGSHVSHHLAKEFLLIL